MNWQQELTRALRGLEEQAGHIEFRPRIEDLGRVQQVGDGVALVDGLNEAMLDEIVIFTGGVQGQVLNLDRDAVGCILYGSDTGVEAGTIVRRTGRAAAMPVGGATLGRVIDPLGRPLDGLGPVQADETRSVEQEAPGVLERQPVHEPLSTGIKAIDAAIPIGLGQRELILGDRETGKTSLALDTIINQRESGVVCVYVSIGSKRATVREVMDELRRSGAFAHTVVIVADTSDPAPLQYLAPYAGATIAEWFAAQGRHALVVYDDLARHAEAYRSLSLLLRRAPSREAYPGDIFYAHARLMERAFKLSADRGGGSVTALPILETRQGNMAAFIPTNLISMTDGQLYLSAELFAEGQLPAIDVGRSVSRVGGSAQPAVLREVAANIRLDLAQYDEVKGFARFGAILDESTQRQLEHGRRLTALLQQAERHPIAVSVAVAELWALKQGVLADVAPELLQRFERALEQTSAPFTQLALECRTADSIRDDLAQQLSRWCAAAKASLSVPGEHSP